MSAIISIMDKFWSFVGKEDQKRLATLPEPEGGDLA